MAIDVVGEVTPDELRRGERLHRRPGPAFLAVNLLVSIALSVLAADPGFGTVSRVVSVVALVCVILLVVYRLVDPATLVEREQFPRSLTASFSDVGMLSKSGTEMRRVAWSQLRSWRANDAVFVLRNRDSSIEILPRRVLGQVNAAHLEALLRSRVRRAA